MGELSCPSEVSLLALGVQSSSPAARLRLALCSPNAALCFVAVGAS